jgi:hypothetical protein
MGGLCSNDGHEQTPKPKLAGSSFPDPVYSRGNTSEERSSTFSQDMDESSATDRKGLRPPTPYCLSQHDATPEHSAKRVEGEEVSQHIKLAIELFER